MKKILNLLLIFTSTVILSQNDCIESLVVCGNSGYQDLNVTGIGTQELNGSNTCSSMETNSIWFKLVIKTGGTLGFTLTPNSNSINEDFDFFIFGPNAVCGNLGQAIRCSTTNPSSASQGNNLTGMNGTETETSEGPGPDGNSFVQWLNVSDGDSYFLIIDRPEGNSNFSLNWTGTAIFSEQPTFENPTASALNIEQCDTDTILDEISEFDLSVNTNLSIGSQNNVSATYHTSNNDALIGINPILTPNGFENTSNPQTLYVRLTNTASQCFDVAEFTLTVKPIITIGIAKNLVACDVNNDGFENFNLSENDTNINLDVINNTVSYFNNETDALNNNTLSILPVNYTNTTAYNSETIWARVENISSGCYTVTSFTIEVVELPMVNTPNMYSQCDDASNDGQALFNLTLDSIKEEMVPNYIAKSLTFTYYQDQNQAKIAGIAIPNPSSYQDALGFTQEVVWVRVENSNNCFRVVPLTLEVTPSDLTLSTYTPNSIYQCDNGLDKRDEISSFDLSNISTYISTTIFSTIDVTVHFYETQLNAELETNEILDITNHQNTNSPNSQDIWVRVKSDIGNNCLGLKYFPNLLIVEKLPVANPVTFARQCDDLPTDTELSSEFDTSGLEADLLLGQPNVSVTYFHADGTPLTDLNGNPIDSPFPALFRTISQTITAKVVNNTTNTNNNTACDDSTTIEFMVDTAPVTNPVTIAPACDDGVDDTDGFHEFDTSLIETTLLGGQTGMNVIYTDGTGSVLSSPLPNPLNSNTQTITVTIENPINTSCLATTTIDFIVNYLPEFTVETPQIVCLNGPVKALTFDAELEAYTYDWTDENGLVLATNAPSIDVSKGGIYTITATNSNNCTRFSTIEVNESIIANIDIDDVAIVDDSDNNSITITTANLGIGAYEFAIKKMDAFISDFQDEPYFENLTPGIYTLFIQDKNDCGIAQIDVSVIGFPKFFTPNNDGKNDTWRVLGVNENFYATSAIYIFDRFGKLITQMDPAGEGWDGSFNGKLLTSTDYWFSVQLIDKDGNTREKRGHFSLIRR